jgi:signal transduction histidine kinase
VDISVTRQDEFLNIEVTDNGIGFEAAKFTAKWGRSAGYGLFSIRERLNHLGGFLEVTSKPGQGTTATIMVPLEQNSMLSN